jgi:PAS domain S-box-containing protein
MSSAPAPITDPDQSHRFSLADMPVPMVYARHRIIRDCNVEFATLFGLRREEILDTSFARLYPKIADFVRIGHLWRSHLPAGKVFYDERIMTRGDGGRFWCRVNGRSHHLGDPFAEALYCFQPINRPIKSSGPAFTDRQHQIITLVAQGKSNVMIAGELGLSRRTIESHRARLMQAVGVRNSAELVAWFTAGQRRQ